VKKLNLRSGLMASTTICSAAMSAMAAAGLVATVAALAPAAAEAQDYTSGAVAISVTDSSGAPVPGATVTLTSQAQGISKTLTTSSSGVATAIGLAPGEYDINVTANGFDTYTGSATVIVSQEVTYTYALNTTGASTEVVVKGRRVRQDFNKTTSGLSVDLTTLTSQQAIGRSLEAVTLLAPTVVNSTAFGEPSIGGGSAAENAYYINGLNVTNPDTYVGLATIPFDFFKTTDIQTGGMTAEFGRATGGVVNSTTKSGTNEFMFGVHENFQPQSLAEKPFEYSNSANPQKYNKTDRNSLIFESGGALIKDKLFLYGMVALNDTRTQLASTSGTYLQKTKNTDPFYGLKADWYITPGQHVELTYFDTSSTTHQTRYSYYCPKADDPSTPVDETNPIAGCKAGPSGQTGESLGTVAHPASTKLGGPSWVAKYTGNLSDNVTVSLAYGDTKYGSDFASGSPDQYYSQKYVPTHNGIAAHYENQSPQFYSAATTVDDWERKFTRGDVDWRFEGMGRHHVRFGFDNEDLSMEKVTQLPGKQPIRYYLFPDYSYGFIIYEHLGGKVSSKDSAYYIQDSWDITPTLNLQIGLRDDDFKAKNLSGQQFLSLTGNYAPRLGLSWKPSQDSKWRFTAYYGQNYIPPAMNLGFRGKDLYFIEYFNMPAGGYNIDPATGIPTNMGTPFDGFAPCPHSDSDQAPGNMGQSQGQDACATYGSGTQEPAAAKAAVGLKASRSSEVSLGASYRANDLWSFDLALTYRNLDRVSEDTDFAPQINDYCTKKGMTCTAYNEYHVWNVGDSVTINTFDTLPNGEKQITLTGLGFPTPKRTYYGATFSWKRQYDGKWSMQGSYTYSRSKGNYEGTVYSLGSGTGQTDAGSTQLYDYLHLSDYSNGILPNSRDHEFKVWASYNITPNFAVGANVLIASPYYLSCYGKYPNKTDTANAYGDASHYCLDTSSVGATVNGVNYYDYMPSPMGKGGKTDWTKNVDVSLRYTMPENMSLGGKLILRADIFNLFNTQEITSKNMTAESVQQCKPPYGTATHCRGSINTNFGTPTAYNTSRFIRLGFDLTY
jgi:hypothetical protein